MTKKGAVGAESLLPAEPGVPFDHGRGDRLAAFVAGRAIDEALFDEAAGGLVGQGKTTWFGDAAIGHAAIRLDPVTHPDAGGLAGLEGVGREVARGELAADLATTCVACALRPGAPLGPFAPSLCRCGGGGLEGGEGLGCGVRSTATSERTGAGTSSGARPITSASSVAPTIPAEASADMTLVCCDGCTQARSHWRAPSLHPGR